MCPHCCGNLAGCDYDNDSTSCPYVKATTANVAAVAAAAGSATMLTLSGVLAPRFLKAFTSATLSAVLRLARRKPVTAFEVKVTSKIDEIMNAITTGAIPYEDALVALGGLADSEADATRAAALWRRYEMLSKAKEVGKLALTTTALEDTGVFSWLWAKTSEHVATRAIDTSVSVEVGPPGAPPTSHSGATQNLLVSHLKVFKSEWDFMECCNLFLMYCTTLGLASALTLTSFYEYFVFDSLRRGYSWQLVSCMLYVVFRLCEESGGLVTLANAHEKLHLNTVHQDAETAMTRLYPGAGIFRAHPGKGGNGTQPGGAGDRVWNGKFNSSSSKGGLWPAPHTRSATHRRRRIAGGGAASRLSSRGGCYGSRARPLSPLPPPLRLTRAGRRGPSTSRIRRPRFRASRGSRARGRSSRRSARGTCNTSAARGALPASSLHRRPDPEQCLALRVVEEPLRERRVPPRVSHASELGRAGRGPRRLCSCHGVA
ncbi:MAG: hypothetical protein VX000_01030, partial [Myxococcota bacterium]|nr:hypothetical protein [Myxococcota bacterium]